MANRSFFIIIFSSSLGGRPDRILYNKPVTVATGRFIRETKGE